MTFKDDFKIKFEQNLTLNLFFVTKYFTIIFINKLTFPWQHYSTSYTDLSQHRYALEWKADFMCILNIINETSNKFEFEQG